jgi:hypothetical protein
MTAKSNPKVKHSVDSCGGQSKGNPAPLGNTYATKLKDEELRQEAYRQYCKHIAQGRSKESWKFLNPIDPLKSLCHKTMERYIEENPLEFPTILINMAYADSFNVFEQLGMQLVRGEIKNGSPETWKTFMRNKFKWDKDDLENVAACAADKILERLTQK